MMGVGEAVMVLSAVGTLADLLAKHIGKLVKKDEKSVQEINQWFGRLRTCADSLTASFEITEITKIESTALDDENEKKMYFVTEEMIKHAECVNKSVRAIMQILTRMGITAEVNFDRPRYHMGPKGPDAWTIGGELQIDKKNVRLDAFSEFGFSWMRFYSINPIDTLKTAIEKINQISNLINYNNSRSTHTNLYANTIADSNSNGNSNTRTKGYLDLK